MISLVLATENHGKLFEFRELLGKDFDVLSLSEANFKIPLPEEGTTSYEENASIKAVFVGEKLHRIVLGDDSGFEVSALGGDPGIRSARFAQTKDSALQRREILRLLKNETNRAARFVCYLAAYEPENSKVHLFFGEVKGQVAIEEQGEGGFGYDAIFIPEGYSKTFAELSLDEKNRISHRARAIGSLRQTFPFP